MEQDAAVAWRAVIEQADTKKFRRLADECVPAPRPDAQWDCAYFYALGDRYFVSESDTDRAAKVGARTVKP